MHALLRRLGRRCARSHWTVVAAWLVVLIGLLAARAAFGGSSPTTTPCRAASRRPGRTCSPPTSPQQSGRSGQIVFATRDATPLPPAPVNASVANVARLPHVIATVSPFATSPSPLVDPAGDIAYATVNFDVVPNTLDQTYLDQLNTAVAPARAAGLQVEYGGGAGQIAQQADDRVSEVIGLVCALLLLLFMFGSIVAAALPLLSALFSVLAGLSLLSLLAAAFTFPTAAPTVATLLGLGVAIDYGLFLVARYRERLDAGGDPIGRRPRRTPPPDRPSSSPVPPWSSPFGVVCGRRAVHQRAGGGRRDRRVGDDAGRPDPGTGVPRGGPVIGAVGAARRRERRGGDGPAPLDHEDNAFARWGRRVTVIAPVPWGLAHSCCWRADGAAVLHPVWTSWMRVPIRPAGRVGVPTT